MPSISSHVVLTLAMTLAAPFVACTSASAQDFQYDCQNEPVQIEIPGDRLDKALDALRLQTRCPISGTELARGKRSKPIVGTMVPEEALQAMLNGTGLQERQIKGGFQIVRLRRR